MVADQEFLASFAVDVDEAGASRLQSVLTENRELADNLAKAFSAASGALHQFIADLNGSMPSLGSFAGYGVTTEGAFGLGGMALGLDLSTAQADLKAFTEQLKKPISLSVNTSGIVSAARTAWNNVSRIFSQPITMSAKVKTENSEGEESQSGGLSLPQMSTGGRFSKPTSVEVAEDGDAEYIIPVKKEDRALPLLRQLLGELSPSAREKLNGSGAFSSLSNGISAGDGAGSVTINNQNLSAPVNIHVTASGGKAEDIGQSIYDTAERYLLRTLREVSV